MLATSAVGGCGGLALDELAPGAAGDAGLDSGVNVDAGSALDDAALDAGSPATPDASPEHECVVVEDAESGPKPFYCAFRQQVRCNFPAEELDCSAACPANPVPGATGVYQCVSDESGLTDCYQCIVGGRRPHGLALAAPAEAPPAGVFFARLASLEAASVDAFEILADELTAHGGPTALVRRARRAAADERRHARVTADLASRYGGSPVLASVARGDTRDIEAIAIDNASEGCVRETFGALAAMCQAERAEDPEVQHAMRRIADDETQHAALSWDVASWLSSKLDDAALERVANARAEAVTALVRETARELHADVVRFAGMPTAAEAERLVDGLRATLWSNSAPVSPSVDSLSPAAFPVKA